MESTPLTVNPEEIITNERLRLLAWGYYFSAGVGAVFSLFFLLYALIFGALSLVPEATWAPAASQPIEEGYSSPPEESLAVSKPQQAPPMFVFRILSGVMIVGTLGAWLFCFLTFWAGRCLQKRKHRLFINVIATYNTLWIPYGTLLGVLTMITINSGVAKSQFEK